MPRYRARYFGEIPGSEPHSIRRIAQGEEFDYDGKPGMWMEPVTGDAPSVRDESEPEVNTLSAIAEVEARRQRDAQAQLEGKQPEARRKPGSFPKAGYQAS
jgi:hypothetical protein